MDLAAVARSSLAELREIGYDELRARAPCIDDEISVPTKKGEQKVTRVIFVEPQANGELVVIVKVFKRSWLPFMSYASAEGFRIDAENEVRELNDGDKATLY